MVVAASYLSYTYSTRDVVYYEDLAGWKWKVRARFGGTFGEWSTIWTFSVEPVNTDCR